MANTLSASTIVNMLKDNTDDESFEPQDVLMLIGPDTDLELLLAGLQEVDNCIYTEVMKYALFHYPEVAIKHLIGAADFETINHFMASLGGAHEKSKKLQRNSPRNIIDKMIEPTLKGLIDRCMEALKVTFAKHPGTVIANREGYYGSFFPGKVMDYIQLECKKDMVAPVQKLNITKTSAPEDLKVRYQAMVDSVKEIIAQMNEGTKDFPGGYMQEPLSMAFRVDIDRLDYKSLPAYKVLPANLKAVADDVTSVNMHLRVNFNKHGKVHFNAMSLSPVEIMYSPKGNKILNQVCDPKEYSDYCGQEEFYRLGVGRMVKEKNSWTGSVHLEEKAGDQAANKAARTAANSLLYTFKKEFMELFAATLAACVPNMKTAWSGKTVKMWDCTTYAGNGEHHLEKDTPAYAFKLEVMEKVKELYAAEEAAKNITLQEVK